MKILKKIFLTNCLLFAGFLFLQAPTFAASPAQNCIDLAARAAKESLGIEFDEEPSLSGEELLTQRDFLDSLEFTDDLKIFQFFWREGSENLASLQASWTFDAEDNLLNCELFLMPESADFEKVKNIQSPEVVFFKKATDGESTFRVVGLQQEGVDASGNVESTFYTFYGFPKETSEKYSPYQTADDFVKSLEDFKSVVDDIQEKSSEYTTNSENYIVDESGDLQDWYGFYPKKINGDVDVSENFIEWIKYENIKNMLLAGQPAVLYVRDRNFIDDTTEEFLLRMANVGAAHARSKGLSEEEILAEFNIFWRPLHELESGSSLEDVENYVANYPEYLDSLAKEERRKYVEERLEKLTDVDENAWYFGFVRELLATGAADGYADNTFRPADALNRAEAVKITVELFDIPILEKTETKPFSDVATDAWYAPYVVAAKSAGIVSGYPDGTFRGSQPVNRAEFLKMLIAAADVDVPDADDSNLFSDVDADAWFAPYVAFAKQNGIISGYSDGSFRPGQTVNRAEMSKIATEMSR